MATEQQIDIEPQHEKLLKELLNKHLNGKTIWAYGSRVKWTANRVSDLDLAVFDTTNDQIYNATEAFGESSLPFTVSLMKWEDLPEDFQENIREKYVVVQGGIEWKQYYLGEIYTFSSGLSKPAKEFGFGHPFLAFKDVFHNTFVPNNFSNLVNSTEKEQDKCSIKKGDVFLTRTSETDEELGLSSVALKDYPKATFNGFTKRLRPKANSPILPEFVAYYLRSRKFRSLVISMASTTTRASLNNSMLEKLTISAPSFSEQKAIAEVLSSLDDKIDLLHRQNKTLEQMAETLFRQWFIEEAREDWEEGVLSDLANVKYGKDHKKLNDGEIPVYGSGGIMRYADTPLYEKESVLIPRKGTLNNVLYINKPFWTVDTMFYTEMKKPNLAKFVYHFVKGHDLANMNVGSAVPSMTTQVLNNMPLSIPSDSALEKFELTISPMYLKIATNENQVHALEKLRDTLLPKLMSGEVKVID